MAGPADNDSPASREEIVAIELLRASIVDLKGAFLANTQRGEEPKGGDKGKEDGTSLGIKKIVQLLLPISIVGGIISGFAPALKLVGSALNLLGTTILPLVMPLFVLLATGLVMLSDKLWGQIEPALDDFYSWIFDRAIPALEKLAQAFDWFVVFLQELQDSFRSGGPQGGKRGAATLNEKKAAKTAAENAEIVRSQALKEGKSKEEADRLAGISRYGTRKAGDHDLLGEVDRLLKAGMTKEVADKRAAERGKAAPGGGGKGSAMGSMREVFAEMRSSMGPKAQFSDIASLSKNATLAGLNQSPFETKVLDRMQKMIDAMERSANNTAKTPAPRYDAPTAGAAAGAAGAAGAAKPFARVP